jgi:hypothetical protein
VKGFYIASVLQFNKYMNMYVQWKYVYLMKIFIKNNITCISDWNLTYIVFLLEIRIRDTIVKECDVWYIMYEIWR